MRRPALPVVRRKERKKERKNEYARRRGVREPAGYGQRPPEWLPLVRRTLGFKKKKKKMMMKSTPVGVE
jgi:hypothetical protein